MTDQSIALLAASWFTGGLAGSILTLTTQCITRIWQRPTLEIAFDDKDSGCCILTVTNPRRHHVRIKIINSGQSTARNVSVCVTKLTLKGSTAGAREFSEEVFDLKLVNHDKVSLFVLAPKGHRYLDLAHISEGDPTHFDFDLQPELGRLRERDGFGANKGDYGVEVFASADNAKAIRRAISWSWDGQFSGLKNFSVSHV